MYIQINTLASKMWLFTTNIYTPMKYGKNYVSPYAQGNANSTQKQNLHNSVGLNYYASFDAGIRPEV